MLPTRAVLALAALLVPAACSDAAPGAAPDAARAADDAGAGADAEPIDAGGDPSALARIRVELPAGTAPIFRPGDTAALRAIGVRADGTELELTAAATWSTSSATTAEVLAGGAMRALAAGRAELRAARAEVVSAPLVIRVEEVPMHRPTELRGVWVTRWSFSSTADLDAILDDVEGAKLNAIFFQARGTADAYYASTLEPWAARLGGALGRDPGWDPLGEMIQRAHARGIQVHAWLNTFPAWSGTTPPAESTPRHPLLAHPEWLCADEHGAPMPPAATGYQFFSPGNPEVRAHIAAVVEELATRYALDGVHMDFVRYPGANYCHDAVSEAEYAAAQAAEPGLSWADFQRQRVTLLVAELRARVQRVRPSAALTVASWGIYENSFGWTSVSQGNIDFYQDAHRWAREGAVDALCPMIYWALTEPRGGRTDFATLTDDHLAATRAGRRYMFSGINAELTPDQVIAEIEYARSAGAQGFVLFDLSLLRTNGHLPRLSSGPLAEPAEAPRMPFVLP